MRDFANNSLRHFTTTCLWLWALPLTLLGLIVFAGARVAGCGRIQCITSQHGWVFAAVGGSLARLLQSHPLGSMAAVAIGCCVYAVDAKALAQHLPHELVHVRQAQCWGLLFPLAYLGNSVWHWCCGRCPYADNFFEKQANRLANEAHVSIR
jgi:hypothetical protein